MHMAQYNVFVFNFMEKNYADVKRLQETFEALRSRVKIYQQLNKNDFKTAVKQITEDMDFELFEYIVIVVLDDKNKYRHTIRTSDGEEVFINAELLTYIQQNKSLANKKRLFLIQTNQELIKEREEYKAHIREEGKGVIYAGPTTYLWAVDAGEKLPEYWADENPGVSPFVRAFCNNFQQHGTQLEIKSIHDRMLDDMRDCDETPVIEYDFSAGSGGGVFGYALSVSALRDFFPN